MLQVVSQHMHTGESTTSSHSLVGDVVSTHPLLGRCQSSRDFLRKLNHYRLSNGFH